MYLLRVSQPGGVVEIRGTVQASLRKTELHAEAEGLDLTAMSFVERGKYVDDFWQEHGHSHYVILLMYGDELKGGPTRKIQSEAYFSELFCKLYLRLTAAYEYNNSDYPSCGDGYYADTIDYEPWGVDPKLIRHFTADWAFSSNSTHLHAVSAPRRGLLGAALDLWRARRS